MSSESNSRRRQIGFFLLVVILPSAVLIALGVQLERQERELARQQAIDERQLVVARARDALLGTLERVQRRALEAIAVDTLGLGSKANVGPTVVVATRADGGVLRLPWTPDRRAELGRAAVRAEPFAQRIVEGARSEFAAGDVPRAVTLYQDALAAARDSIQEAYASLLLARALDKTGRQSEAVSLNRRLLALPHHVTDEVGLPIALYAAARLLEGGTGGREVIEKVDAILREPRWRSPAQAYMLRGLLDQAATILDSAERRMALDLESFIESEIAVIERTIDLKVALPGLGLPSGGTPERAFGPHWIRFAGDWLVGSAPMSDDGWGIVAVSIPDVIELVTGMSSWPAAASLITADAAGHGEPLEPAVGGMRIAVLDDALQGRGAAQLRRGLYWRSSSR